MDEFVGELIRQLEGSGLIQNTLVVFTSDHGEEFYDHKSVGHGHSVYEELLRVPLIMRLDGVLPAGHRVHQPVELIDVSPTILDLLGLEIPDTMQGQSLLGYIENPETPPRANSLASSAKPLKTALRHGRWKLIHRSTGWIAKEGVQLFDLTQDPQEKRDVSLEQPVVTEALRQMLAWHLERDTPVGQEPVESAVLDEETRASLEALGYIEEIEE